MSGQTTENDCFCGRDDYEGPGKAYLPHAPACRAIYSPAATTDPITCTGCTREVTVGELCVHSGATCALCCGKYCGGAA